MGSSFRTAFRRAAVRATYAPSMHNTQPWRLELRADGINLYADQHRRLRRLDSYGRQLVVSCGAALFNARASLAADGVAAVVQRRPDPIEPDLLAVVSPAIVAGAEDGRYACLDKYIDRRRTSRRIADEPLPEVVVQDLEAIGAEHGVHITAVTDPAAKTALADVLDRSRRIAELDAGYRLEWQAWSQLSGEDFGADLSGGRLAGTGLVICTDGDDVGCWLRAGEALEQALLQLTEDGIAASFCSHVIEIPAARAQLRHGLGLSGQPQVLLSLGRSLSADPPTRRRRLLETICEDLG